MWVLGLLGAVVVQAQVVEVSLSLSTNRVAVGATVVLEVQARITASRTNSVDRIFSWCVDVLNGAPGVASCQWGELARPGSDNDPLLSSSGFNDAGGRNGIYDTFLNLAGAGRDQAVVLVRVPVVAVKPGVVAFSARAGTGAPAAPHDFIVAPRGGGTPLFGGLYGRAMTNLTVMAGGGVTNAAPVVRLECLPVSDPSGVVRSFEIRFSPDPAWSSTVEGCLGLPPLGRWVALPGAPHDRGVVSVTNGGGAQFFRVLSRPR